ncbi:MAG TPA: MBL fold metallo-hydrolase RNA specificity domain-containing protein [Atribacterota bacterium]|nr:MBL fold metallo-hydrolase RNA specificity domain-containing protein [Atribacterota bacterium]
MKIHFWGAAGLVTGSNYLLEIENKKILIDCGMFQGGRQINRLNFQPYPYNPEEIDFLILTHAHIDHSGRIPSLIKAGFKGRIYCTKATYDLCSIMLPDSGHIQEMETEWDNRKRGRAGLSLRKPLYTVEEALNSLHYFSPVLYQQKITIDDSLTFSFQDAGHILGSAIVELWVSEKNEHIKIVFSGDLGRKNKPIIRDPAIIEEADYLILDSTYGNRIHPPLDQDAARLIPIITETSKRGGNIIIPSFAIQRAQDIIYELNKYYDRFIAVSNDDFLDIPVYIDSPLTISATEIFKRNPDCFSPDALDLIRKGDNPLDFHNLHFSRTTQESRDLNISPESKVIISASGMCTAGRIKHHLKHNLWRKESSIVFIGYQAEGTLGRRIQDGAKKVNIFGEEISSKAEIHVLEGFSGHADQEEIIQWLGSFSNKPKKVFLVHGEQNSLHALSDLIQQKLNLDTIIPQMGDNFIIKGVTKAVSIKDAHTEIKKEQRKLEEETNELKEIMEQVLEQMDNKTKEEISKEEASGLRNKMLALRKEGLELSMLLTRDKKRKASSENS